MKGRKKNESVTSNSFTADAEVHYVHLQSISSSHHRIPCHLNPTLLNTRKAITTLSIHPFLLRFILHPSKRPPQRESQRQAWNFNSSMSNPLTRILDRTSASATPRPRSGPKRRPRMSIDRTNDASGGPVPRARRLEKNPFIIRVAESTTEPGNARECLARQRRRRRLPTLAKGGATVSL